MLRQYQQEIAALRAELSAPRGAAGGDHGGAWRCCSVHLAALEEPSALAGGADLAAQVPCAVSVHTGKPTWRLVQVVHLHCWPRSCCLECLFQHNQKSSANGLILSPNHDRDVLYRGFLWLSCILMLPVDVLHFGQRGNLARRWLAS